MFRHARNLIRSNRNSSMMFCGRVRLASVALMTGLLLASGAAAQVNSGASGVPAKASYSKIPLNFEANQGQADSQVRFLSRGDGYSLFLTSNAAVLKLRTSAGADTPPATIRMEMLHALPTAQVSGTDELPGIVNYFIGNDPKRWHRDIETYAKVKYQSVYPGVDAVFYGNQRQFEYDFVVAPGADPSRIALGLSGVSPVLDADGNVVLKTAGGDLLLCKPVVYQGAENHKTIIDAGYVLSGDYIRFKLGKYDRSQPLVIDPKFETMTYLGGSGTDFVGAGTSPYGGISPTTLLLSNALAVDSSGNTYVTGQTYSADFPTHAGYENAWAGYSGRNQAAFVSKINAAGTAFVYSTYLAGSDPNTDSDNGTAIAVDASGDAYVVGWTESPDFPVTKGAYQTTVGNLSTFVTKLNPSGNGLVYSTVLGGASPSYSAAYGIAVDSKGQAYVVGNVSDNDAFPFTSNALLTKGNQFAGSGFVTVFNAAGSSLLYSSLIGDAQALQFNTTAQGVAVDPSGNFYVTGSTESPNMPATAGAYQTTFATPNTSTVAGFAAKFGPVGGSGNLLTYLTYLHATTIGNNDWGAAITADSSGNAYVAGFTQSSTFPTTTGAYQTTCPNNCAFVTKLNPTGAKLVWSTLLGGDNPNPGINGTGSVGEYVSSIALDALGNVYVAGAAGDGFPTVNSVESGSFVSGGFISKLNPTGSSLLFSSLIGDQGVNNWISGAAVDPLGNISVGGVVQGVADGLPVTSGAPQTTFGGGEYDGFVAKIHIETPDLTIAKTHTGDFIQGENAAGYSVTVSNIGDGPTSGIVTVTEAIPTGLSLEAMEGTGWTCTALPACTRADALAAGGSYPPITVTVNVASNALASVTNMATVSGGSEYNFSNDSASDATTILPPPVAPTVGLTLSSSSITTEQALTVTVAVKGPSGDATPSGSVTLTSGSYTSAAATLSSGSGMITVPAGSLAAGSDTLTVRYTPDSAGSLSYLSATATGSVTVTKVTPTVALTLSSSSITTEQALTVTVAVKGVSGGPAPAGTVTLTSGSYTSAAATLSSGSATISIIAGSLAAGSDPIKVTYTPSSGSSPTFNSATGTSSVTVIKITPSVALTPSASGITTKQILTVTVAVSGGNGNPAPTGSVILTSSSYTSATATLSSGSATISVAAGSLAIGTAALTVTYTPNSSSSSIYNSATGSASVTVTVPTAGLQFIPVTPCRIVDTRNAAGAFGGPELAGGVARSFDVPQSGCGIPSTAVAYSLNATVVPIQALGYLTVWPAGEAQPNVSTLNSDGRVKANATITPAGTNGGVSVFASDATQFILDIDGYFVPAGTSASGLEFYPVTPCRVADTRNVTGALGGPSLAANTARAFPVQSSLCGIPATAKAYSLNVTAVPHGSLGYLTVWPSGQSQPVVSTLNAATGAVTANAAIVPTGTGGDISIFVSDTADVILDVNGYFAPPASGGLSLYTVTPCRAIDTRNGAGAFDGTLTMPIHASICEPPATAQAYVLNATVVPTTSFSFLSLWAAGAAQPVVSTLNANDGAVTSNMAIVPTTNGGIDAFASNSTNLILDIASYFAP